MRCPYCSHTKSKVTDKRSSPTGTRRRRECLKCSKRFTTYEEVDKGDLFIIKKGGIRERFDLSKIRRGIERACEKRPVTEKQISNTIQDIEDSLRKKGKKELKSNIIGEMVMRKLKKLDNIAYIRFASVYKDFKDLDDFKKEIKGL